MDLKANTAVDVLIGPFVDSTDGDTAETGLTLSQADIKLSKNGQTLAQKNDATAATHDANGYYNCELDATDTNTEGLLVLIVHESGALPVRHEFNVLSEAAWDSLYAAKDTGYMDVNVKAIGDDTDAATNSGNYWNGAVQAGTVTTGTSTTQFADTAFPSLGDDRIIGGVIVFRDPTDGVGLQARLITDFTNTGRVFTVSPALATTPSATDPYLFFPSPSGAAEANLTEIMGTALTETNSGDVSESFAAFFDVDPVTTKTVDDVGVAGSGLTQQNVRDAMKLAPTAGAPAAGSVDTHLDDILEDTGTTLPAEHAALPTAAENRAEMDSNSTQLAAIIADTADMQPKLGTPAADVSADIAAVKAETANIVADTNELQTDWTNGGRLDLILDAILVDTDTTIPGLIAALENVSVADLLGGEITELAADPGASPSLKGALALLYMAIRNKIDVTATAKEIHNNAGAAVFTKTLSDDGTTYSETKMA